MEICLTVHLLRTKTTGLVAPCPVLFRRIKEVALMRADSEYLICPGYRTKHWTQGLAHLSLIRTL